MGLSFAAPLALFGLLALPAIYWLLRVTPPRPRETMFPPIELLRKLAREERAKTTTPWPLLLLRLAVAGLVALAMAGPVWNFRASAVGGGALLLVLDDGWPAAPRWEERIEAALGVVGEAARADRPVALLPMSEAATPPAPNDGARVKELLTALRPRPWRPDRAPAAAQIAPFLKDHPDAQILWIADGVDGPGALDFAKALRAAAEQGAHVETLADPRSALALARAENGAKTLEVSVLNAAAGALGFVEALDEKARVIAKAPFDVPAAGRVAARFDLPVELRNDARQLRIAGEDSAGAVALLDARSRVRRVAIVGGALEDAARPLLAQTHYLERALAPFSQMIKPPTGEADPVLAALDERPDILILADAKVAPGEAFERLADFVEAGGVLLRFAGPRLANEPDGLTPVRLRRNGRVLGGSMSWDEPKRLADFDASSPFFGLKVPRDVTVSRQILAEPDPGLAEKTWARLADGTPLVTFERRGKGFVAMFHVGAEAGWSSLPISGLFVDMLKRICDMAGESGTAVAPNGEGVSLAPLQTLDGFGTLGAPPATAKPIPADFTGAADPEHPPGFYGSGGAARAVPTLAASDTLRPFDFAAIGAAPRGLDLQRPALDLRGPLLAAIVVLLLVDWLALLWLSGRLRLAPLALALIAGLAASAPPPAARAETAPKTSAPHDREAALKTRLAYVVSGDAKIDETSRLGLETLTRVLDQRTSFSGGEPAGVDVGRDELALYPMLYWPIDANAPQPSAQAKARVSAYMKNGGTVVFDTRDALTARANAAPTPESLWLRELAKGLDIPELEPAPRDHVITKTFYLLDGFVGRYAYGETYVEALPPEAEGAGANRPVRATDNVSAVVIVSNDLAGAWAQDKAGQPLYPLTPGLPRQREFALRGGINLVMYTLTGNYKSDQVHVRDLLQRLGQ